MLILERKIMINEEVTFKKFNYYSWQLKPKSGKKVITICSECSKIREVKKQNYRDLCQSCSKKGSRHPKFKYGACLKEISCIDCGIKLSKYAYYYGYIRCKKCNYKSRDITKRKYYCRELNCNNKINYKNYRTGQNRCKTYAGRRHSIKQKDKNNSFYNKTHACDYKEKMSLLMKGRKVSEESRKKMSLSKGGTGIPYENNKYPKEFFKIRLKILKRDNYTCQLCQKYGNSVHHIDYNKHNNEKYNLSCLCHKCNIKVNQNRKYWIEIFLSKNKENIEK